MIKKIDTVNIDSLIRKHKMISMAIVSENYTKDESYILNILETYYDITKLKSYIQSENASYYSQYYMDEYGDLVFALREDYSIVFNNNYTLSHFNKHILSLYYNDVLQSTEPNYSEYISEYISSWLKYKFPNIINQKIECQSQNLSLFFRKIDLYKSYQKDYEGYFLVNKFINNDILTESEQTSINILQDKYSNFVEVEKNNEKYYLTSDKKDFIYRIVTTNFGNNILVCSNKYIKNFVLLREWFKYINVYHNSIYSMEYIKGLIIEDDLLPL